ncbi:MAG TPA: UDP-N-acetylmuramate--L-alanine ligase [Gemmatimonadaceae bacterium]|nr:UDP-N-acetylmuramate--L-alanine ligase [Gemmatimonadaceae bacterium]
MPAASSRPHPIPPALHASSPVHFVGIAGAGMSALAELLARRGVPVTGCDAHPAAVADLEQLGIAVAAGHDPHHVEGASEVIVTSAVPRDHPELAHARALGIPVVRRAEALARAVSVGTVVGIAGTHGKTTTTVMTTEALAAAGRDPTGIAGGRVGAWGGNLRPGGDAVFVVEADEYDRSFLALDPTVAVITNVEADHLDIYADVADIRGAFETFASHARTVVLCADDPGASALALPDGADVVSYGLAAPHARVIARELRVHEEGGSRFVLSIDGAAVTEVVLQVPGRHNVLNALAALAAGWALGADPAALARGLQTFTGVERRFQRVGEAAGVLVIDDYAHHPTEIRATLEAARAAFPGRRVLVAFQPHLYTRTRDFAAEFGRALALADAIFLTEIYPAREQPIEGVTAGLIAEPARAAGGALAWRGERARLADALAATVRRGDVVLTMGAGDITRTGPELLERLVAAR